MTEYFEADKLEDAAVNSLKKDLGQQAEVEGHLVELRSRLDKLSEDAPPLERAELLLQISDALQFLERGEESWPVGHTAFGIFLEHRDWQRCAEACDILYQCDQPDSLIALGQGIWLGVTFPINPETTVHLLSHVVDDTPDDSDGAAVAAATACFISDIRAEEGADRDRLEFFSRQLLGTVARRHSEVENQEQFDYWIEKLELNDPDKFLVRLRNVVDVLVQEDWWFDREALQSKLPN